MIVTLSGTVIDVKKTVAIKNGYFVTDVVLERKSGEYTQYHLLKLFHKVEDHDIINNENYSFDVELRGKKNDKNGDIKVFNEFKINKYSVL